MSHDMTIRRLSPAARLVYIQAALGVLQGFIAWFEFMIMIAQAEDALAVMRAILAFGMTIAIIVARAWLTIRRAAPATIRGW